MAAITVQTIALTGLEATYASASSGGDSFANTGRELIHIKNGDASDHTITIDSTKDCDQGVDHDPAVVVTASEERFIGPFDPNRFGTTVNVTYDAVTSVTIAVFKLPEV